MKLSNTRNLMAKAKFYEAYSRYDTPRDRYEEWPDSVSRVMAMHRKKYAHCMTNDLNDLFEEVEDTYSRQLFLGAQRALQFGGDQLLKHNARLYNCASTWCDRPNVFGGIMYLLLCGSGVGFSVQRQHISKLPPISSRTLDPLTFVVPDTIEGWSQAIDVLMSSFFTVDARFSEYSGHKVYFDLSEIRPKGAFISGGFKAPGSEPLRTALDLIERILKTELSEGHTYLRPIVAYDVIMYLADAVIAGGVRRSATICMFSKDDEEMITAKTGDWRVTNPQRGRSNNSCMFKRDEVTFEELAQIMQSVKEVGEPGFIFVDNLDFTLNPCVEIGMLPVTSDGRSGFQMCNLVEINGMHSTSDEAFYYQCKVSSILSTLQAGYTDFGYLADATREIVEREALIGVGITGIMNNPQVLANSDILIKGAAIVKYWNQKVAELIGINQAARTCCIKPSGNASVLLGTASGIHGEHSPLYLRHVQLNRDSEIAKLFLKQNPQMCEDSVYNRERDITVAFPVVSPTTSIYKSELLGTKQLDYVKLLQQTWIEAGTNVDLCTDPRLRHNVSNTITVDDWDEVTRYIFDNRYYLCGVSLLSAAGDRAYPQAPFTEVLAHEQVVSLYGEVALFTSALIENALTSFNNDLWLACSTALGYGETLLDGHEHLLKRDFVRRFHKFAEHFESADQCANCLKDVYNLHKWWRIQKDLHKVDWSTSLVQKEYTDINTLGAQACSGGACDLGF